jgi:hypothetical protein
MNVVFLVTNFDSVVKKILVKERNNIIYTRRK